MKEPRPYQLEAWSAIHAAVARGVKRMLCVSWPGTGKTHMGAQLREKLGVKRMLILGSGREILHQWKDEIEEVDPDASVAIEQGDIRDATSDHDVVIGSIPTLCKPWRRHKLSRPYDLVQVDEADLSYAQTW